MQLACFAASNTEKYSVLHVASNGQSSSLLEPGTHLDHHPSISFNKEIHVAEQRIDTYIKREGIDAKNFNFINLDIQGYELKALQGASDILSKIDFIYTEVNTEDVYKDCANLTEIDNFLSHYGFSRTWLSMTKNGWGDAFYSKGNRYMNKTSFIGRAVAEKVKNKIVIMVKKLKA
jgi:FkbM family methyltransferase